jgi:hypothetical protein
MSEPLPAGWAGNLAHHHTMRGAFRLEVWRRPDRRYVWALGVGLTRVTAADPMGHPDAATARAAVLARLAEIVGEVDEVPVALALEDLPTSRPFLPSIWVDGEGMPHPVLASQHEGEVYARFAANTAQYVDFDHGTTLVVYPESAAPALWRAYLRGRS